MEILAGLSGLWMILLAVLAVLWFFMPFIIYSMSGKMTRLLSQTTETTKLFKDIASQLNDIATNTNETNKLLWELIQTLKQQKPPAKQHPALPARKKADVIKLMVKYKIKMRGKKYIFNNKEFNTLDQAINKAKTTI